ncbi:MAG TPA: ABC transporter ATP-binding protein [Jiangellaceae bacterium]|nr:ABC transporter ATP-binding protein [Jiangellaceae bacterium]
MSTDPHSPGEQLTAALPGLRRTLHHVRPHLRPHRWMMLGGLLAMFAEVAFRLLEPWPLKYVLDAVIQPGAGTDSGLMTLIMVAAVALLGVAALRALSAYAMTVFFTLAGTRAMTNVRGELYAHLQRLSLRFHRGSRTGDLINRLVGDVGRVQEVAVTAALPLIGNIVALVGMTVVMLVLDWQLALIVVAAFPVFLLGSSRQGRKITTAARKQRRREGDLAGTASETLGAMTVVHAYGLQRLLQGKFAASNAKSLRDGVKASRLSAGLERGTDVLVGLATGVVLLIGAMRVLDGALSPGELTVFISYLKSAFKPMRDLAKYTGRLAKAAASGERIVDLLETEPDIVNHPQAINAPRLRGDVAFTNVVASYGRGHRALVDVDLQIPAGTRVGVLGPSGSGKSTMVSLLPRLMDVDYGRVTIDGTDVRDYTLDSLRAQVSIVLQESVLFATTLAENIRFGRPDATDEEVQQAARDADAHGFITALPNGYDTIVGERGSTLSGGQRQRIAVARAMLREASIVVLDEPLTGVDPTSARSLTAALARLTKGRTTFVISHDTDDIADCDVVVWIEDGRVVDQGSPEEITSRRRHLRALDTAAHRDPNAAAERVRRVHVG